MLIQRLRRNLQREEGQALVMACLMVLILSIAVLTTVNIGHTVHERIRLQNNADATAYSEAAMEARAFNFYSFANRTQVSHYVSAMVWQSFDSFIFFLEAFLTDIFGIMVTLDKCADPPNAFWDVACPLLENAPYIGPFFKFIDKVISLVGDVVKAVQGALKNNVVDKFMAKVIEGHRILNKTLDAASEVMMYAALQHVADPISTATGNMTVVGAGVGAKNDPNLGAQLQQIPLAFLNACYFDRAHYRYRAQDGDSPSGSPFKPSLNPFKDLTPTAHKESDRLARAKRSMAQLSNATRFGCDTSSGVGPLSALCPDGFVTDRRLGSFLPKIKIFGTNVLSGLTTFLNSFPVWGQTRMLTYKEPFGTGGYSTNPPGTEYWKKKGFCGLGNFKYKKNYNRIREATNPPDWPMGSLAQGDDIGADDIYFLSFPPANWTPPGFPPPPFKNPFECGANDDWKYCWGDNRVRQSGDSKYKMPMKTSVWALNKEESVNGGVHWREMEPGNGGPDTYTENFGLNKKDKCALLSIPCLGCPTKIAVYTANVEPRVEDWHRWGGVVRFPHFEPGQYAKPCLQGLSGLRNGDPSMDTASTFATDNKKAGGSSSPGDFNQPSEWVLFHKSPKDMQNPNADDTGATYNNPAQLNDKGTLTFAFTGSQTLDMKDDRKKFLGFVEGITAISRAQTYYHRPGNWNEQPNFFNPYWRPRLASVWQGRKTLPFIGDIVKQLPGPLKKIPQKIITH